MAKKKAKKKAVKKSEKKSEEKKPEEKKSGDQIPLIDVAPENCKELIAAAKLYKEYQQDRMSAAAQEADQKALIIELMHKSELQPLAGGKLKFEHDGFKITVTPRDELVQVKQTDESVDVS